ncbi:MAG: Hsp70 family protein [Planctomycetota bacterium]
MASVDASLTDAGLTADQVDAVVLVGGSTILVRRLLRERFGKEPMSDLDPDLAVALGAAVQASILAGRDDSLLLDVVPLSLGIETLGGAFAKLVMRNSTVPCSHTEEFTTRVDDQTGIQLHVYQGERELVQDCRPIGDLELRGIPPMKAAPRVAVIFSVDADGILRVIARELRSGQTASAELPVDARPRRRRRPAHRDRVDRARRRGLRRPRGPRAAQQGPGAGRRDPAGSRPAAPRGSRPSRATRSARPCRRSSSSSRATTCRPCTRPWTASAR